MTRRTFLITGASKGIGRALSHQLAAAGHRILGITRDAGVPDFPGTLVSLDLADRAAMEAGMARLATEHDFDGVVNNVGLVRPQRLGRSTLTHSTMCCASISIRRCSPYRHCCPA